MSPNQNYSHSAVSTHIMAGFTHHYPPHFFQAYRSRWVCSFMFGLEGLLVCKVLIVYVSNPPVSNAVQGAYFVAAFITGVVLGAASLVLIDVTEGLGCLLGGFCISMWLLTLKAGGLITSTAGKAVFIAAFCLVAYALSFNSYTRPYGLIGGTSFAGATAVVVGIDCYSRAGLKEFWLYLWGEFGVLLTFHPIHCEIEANYYIALNANIFPLGISTYPITRGIRVEIACIILFFLLGIMSQLKIWKVIKERRQQKTARLQDEERRREQNEEELGRRIKDANDRERGRWEAVYGDKEQPTVQHVDSGIASVEIGSVRKGSTSITKIRRVEEPSNEGIEMENLEVETRPDETDSLTKIGDTIQGDRTQTIQLDQEEDTVIGGVDAGSLRATAAKSNSFSQPRGMSVADNHPDVNEGTASTLQDNHETESASDHPSTSGEVSMPPQVTPLPFTIPSADPDDASSMAVSAASDHFQPWEKNRLSGASLCRTPSKQSQQFRLESSSKEALAVPQEFDDRPTTPSGTASISLLHNDHKEEEQTPSDEREKARASITRKPVPSAALWQSECSLGAADVVDALIHSRSDIGPQSLGLANSVVPSEPLNGCLQRNSLSEHLPEGGSPVVITYRTNEWAKHLDRADKPGLDELDSSLNELGPGNEQVEEIPVRVDVVGLQQTSGVPRTARSSSQSGGSGRLEQLPTGGTPFTMPKDSLLHVCRPQAKEDPSVSASGHSPARVPSQIPLQNLQTSNGLSYQASTKPTSQRPTIQVTRSSRGTSTTLTGQALVKSPIEEGVETSFPPRVISPMSNNTLMAKRDTLLRNKYSFTTLTHPPVSAADQAAELMASDAASVRSNATSSLDDDNVPLSQRRSLLRQGERHTSLPQTQASSPHDFPRPHRSSSAVTDLERRDLMLASWRSSVRQGLNPNSHPQVESELDVRRKELMNEKYQLGLNRHQRATNASYRESMIDQAMRRGDMLDVHREAMRKMQAAVNKNT